MKRLIPLLCTLLSIVYGVNETPPHSQSLNQTMTVQEQKDTGINKLSKQERENLETWLQNHSLQTRPQKEGLEDKTVTNSTLSINIDGGAFLQLYDGSVWEISPQYRNITEFWISPIQISVEIAPGTPWPFKLINQSTNEVVYARRSNLNYAASLPTKKAQPIQPAEKKALKQSQTTTPSQRNS